MSDVTDLAEYSDDKGDEVPSAEPVAEGRW